MVKEQQPGKTKGLFGKVQGQLPVNNEREISTGQSPVYKEIEPIFVHKKNRDTDYSLITTKWTKKKRTTNNVETTRRTSDRKHKPRTSLGFHKWILPVFVLT